MKQIRNQPLVLLPGLALVSFPMSTLLRVERENVLYANLQGQGLAMITGYGHGGVLTLLDYARRTFIGGQRIHAIYGGLHLSPLKDWDTQRDQIVSTPGNARNGSQTDLFLGNGDVLQLGQAHAPKLSGI